LHWGLLAAVGLSYLVMAVGCTADLFQGCTRVCTLVRLTVAPLTLAALFLGSRDTRFDLYAIGLAAVGLVPHCVCDNFANHPWIARIGASPLCFFLPFCVTLAAVSGLHGLRPVLCLIGAAAAVTAAAALGLGHQMLHYPW
jgi:hypothetical protein